MNILDLILKKFLLPLLTWSELQIAYIFITKTHKTHKDIPMASIHLAVTENETILSIINHNKPRDSLTNTSSGYAAASACLKDTLDMPS